MHKFPIHGLPLLVALAACASARRAPLSVSGAVVDGDTGTPVAGARVLLLGTSWQNETGPAGEYALQALRAGDYYIVAVAPECRVAVGRLRLEDGAPRRIDLHVQPWSSAALAAARPATAVPTLPRGATTKVIAGAELRRGGATNVAQAVEREFPEMVSFGNGTAGRSPSVRGRNASARPENLVPLIFVDDVLVGGGASSGSHTELDALTQISLGDVERIEVMRGPAGTVSLGTGGNAGAIKIYTLRGNPTALDSIPARYCARNSRN